MKRGTRVTFFFSKLLSLKFIYVWLGIIEFVHVQSHCVQKPYWDVANIGKLPEVQPYSFLR